MKSLENREKERKIKEIRENLGEKKKGEIKKMRIEKNKSYRKPNKRNKYFFMCFDNMNVKESLKNVVKLLSLVIFQSMNLIFFKNY